MNRLAVRLLAAATALVAPAAYAADSLPSGTTFTVSDISTADAYYATRTSVIGLTCTATGTMTTTPGTSWWGGPAKCGTSEYYFYQAAIQVAGPGGNTTGANTGTGNSVTVPTNAATPGSLQATYVGAGQSFVVRDISTADAYYPTKDGIIGLTCTATGDLSRSQAQYWSGPAKCNGMDYYFYQMAFDLTGAAPTTNTVTTNTTGTYYNGYLGAGDMFQVGDISTADAYYPTRFGIIGLTCTATGEMTQQVAAPIPYYSGPAKCSDGLDYYFYQAGVTYLGYDSSYTGAATAYGDRYYGTYVEKNTVVQVVDVSADDAWYPYKDMLIGQYCTVKKGAGLTWTGDGWFAGTLKCGGTKLYFYQVAVYVIG